MFLKSFIFLPILSFAVQENLKCSHFFKGTFLKTFNKGNPLHLNAKKICEKAYLGCIANRARIKAGLKAINILESLETCQATVLMFQDDSYLKKVPEVKFLWKTWQDSIIFKVTQSSKPYQKTDVKKSNKTKD